MAEAKRDTHRPLREIYFYLTEECNLRCRHCWISPRCQGSERSQSHLDLGLFASIIEQAVPLGLTGVKLSGGEPLLHPAFAEIIQFTKARGLHLTLETNGVLCTERLSRLLAAGGGVAVSVSLDGADAETHEWVRGVPGSFEAAREGVRHLVKAGLKPQIIFTIIRRNVAQMEKIVRLAESLGAGSVKFNLLQPTGRGALMHQWNEVPTTGELVELGRWVETRLIGSTRLRLILHHPPAFRPLGRLFGENGDGCAVCGIKGILGVLHDGSYALCGIGESTRELIFGHAETDELAKVWEEHPVLQEIRTGLPESLLGICADCLVKGVCLGGCVAQNYYRHGNLRGPFWFCEQAHKEHLFPETRLRPDARRQGLHRLQESP